MVLTTGKTTTTRVLAVLAYTTVTGRNVATMLASLREAGRHVCTIKNSISFRALGQLISRNQVHPFSANASNSLKAIQSFNTAF